MFCSAALQVNWLIEVQDSRITRGRAAASVVLPSPKPSLVEMKERKIKEEKAVGMDGWRRGGGAHFASETKRSSARGD